MPVEEQTQCSTEMMRLNPVQKQRIGQRLTISNRKVTKLAFPISKTGSPTGDVTFTIRKVSDDSVINSKVLGDASGVPTAKTWEEVTFDSSILINEEVRIAVEFGGGSTGDYISVYGEISDVKAGEYYTSFAGSWVDETGYDCAYRYTYEVPQPGAPRQQMATFLIGGKRK